MTQGGGMITKLNPHFRYALFFFRHKLEVLKWSRKIRGCSLWRILCHDLSKLRWSEWGPHVHYFFGEQNTSTLEALDVAYMKHIHRNPHHFAHWVLVLPNAGVKCLRIPSPYREELLCDWLARGETSGEDAISWYVHHMQTIGLHPETRFYLETQLEFWRGSRGNGFKAKTQ